MFHLSEIGVQLVVLIGLSSLLCQDIWVINTSLLSLELGFKKFVSYLILRLDYVFDLLLLCGLKCWSFLGCCTWLAVEEVFEALGVLFCIDFIKNVAYFLNLGIVFFYCFCVDLEDKSKAIALTDHILLFLEPKNLKQVDTLHIAAYVLVDLLVACLQSLKLLFVGVLQ